MHDIELDRVVLTPTPAAARLAGHLGYVAFRINRRVQIDGVTLRRTADGEYTLSFPARKDGAGRVHYLVNPVDAETRDTIERQVFEALGLRRRS